MLDFEKFEFKFILFLYFEEIFFMRKLAMSTVLLLASITYADIINCVFTEPFVTSIYSMNRSTLTYLDSENKKKVLNNVSFQIKAAGVFELVKDGKVLQILLLNNQGSDGMSDMVYPYDVEDFSQEKLPNKSRGGCSSNFQSSHDRS